MNATLASPRPGAQPVAPAAPAPAAGAAAAAPAAANGTAAAVTPPPAPRRYALVLGWAFAAFSTLRLFSYLPTIWAIHASGASDQHSLFTWLTWCGANLTMGLMVGEQTQRRFSGCALVSFANAAMCATTALLIVCHR
ncbi:MAG: hypothetical protein KIS83_11230 [Rubrivivax sp.]|nr:hypothetical protein [Rubrivivax sp.]